MYNTLTIDLTSIDLIVFFLLFLLQLTLNLYNQQRNLFQIMFQITTNVNWILTLQIVQLPIGMIYIICVIHNFYVCLKLHLTIYFIKYSFLTSTHSFACFAVVSQK